MTKRSVQSFGPGIARVLLVSAALSSVSVAHAQEVPRDPQGGSAPTRVDSRPSSLPPGTPDEIVVTPAATPVTNLFAALKRAYWSHPSLLAERARMRGTDYRLAQARARFGPQVNFEASHGYQRDNVELFTNRYAAKSGWASTIEAVLDQSLYSFGRNASGERGAVAQIDYQRAALRATEQQVLFQTISAYASVIRDRSAVAIAQENLDLLESELIDSRSRYHARETASTDVQQIATRVEVGRAQLLAAKRAAASSEASFLGVVGSPAGDLSDPSPIVVSVRTLEDAYVYADEHNPVVIAAYARERSSRAERSNARASLMPRIDLRARAGYGATSPYSDKLRQTQLRGEVVLSGPLFQSGLLRSRVGEADAVNDADWHLIDQASRESRIELADAWNEWLSVQASTDNLAKASEFARQAYAGALQQERAGFRTTLDVLDLARELLSARVNYNIATTNAYVARARVLAAIGALDLANLFPDATRYDPDRHGSRVRDHGDVLLLTPILSKVDTLTLGTADDREVRDPATDVTATGVPLEVPPASQSAEALDIDFDAYLTHQARSRGQGLAAVDFQGPRARTPVAAVDPAVPPATAVEPAPIAIVSDDMQRAP